LARGNEFQVLGATKKGKTCMKNGSRFIQFSLKQPKLLTLFIVLAVFICGVMASIGLEIDTDPENMLNADEPVRVFHKRIKKEFTLYDMVVIGIVNEDHPDGVFNPATLRHVQVLTEFVQTLSDPKDPDKYVISHDIIAPGNVDNIKQAGPGEVRFEWLMKVAPATQKEALEIRDGAMANPLIKGSMVSEDGKAICIYAPVSSKSFADQVRTAVLGKVKSMADDNGDRYYITGVPVAEDTFGREQLVEMVRLPPIAMLIIFGLMLFFFRKVKLILSPMMVAMFSVICTMGLLNGLGFTFHLMSSMIPTFLMPIAIVDSIHILSEFFDTHYKINDRRKSIEHVMDQLFVPMLYTSLTSAAGFASLALAPIPPIRVFGIFMAIGIMLAWLFTILFIPAYIMMLKEETLADIGQAASKLKGKADLLQAGPDSLLARGLRRMGRFAFGNAKVIVVFAIVLFIGFSYGITKIESNDNPLNWFAKNHPIRVADRALNKHFDGIYEIYLVLGDKAKELDMTSGMQLVREKFEEVFATGSHTNPTLKIEALSLVEQAGSNSGPFVEYLDALISRFELQVEQAPEESVESWALLLASLESVRDRGQIFKSPEVLRYVEGLQAHLLTSGKVAKSNSVIDVVKKVHQELYESDPEYFRVPDSAKSVAECLISYQNSHRPDDLWHFVTPDYSRANIWIQLRDGDNKTSEAVVRAVEEFMADNPPPVLLEHQWAGLNYINIVWQDKMVSGMGKALLGSFVIVFIMMTILFRSPLFGILSMLPLSLTIVVMYGFIGWIGKDYDMPVAVLSCLALGLAVDFAIHFLQRARDIYAKTKSWALCTQGMFEEPARAISRNIIIIAVGFTPMLFSTLSPFRTVGALFATIMVVSGICTLLLLPACLTLMRTRLFGEDAAKEE
jgi:hypothetical protein